ncbi:hypothetical protein N7520_004009 [Penicillium odoratum]|uniref:uncharacterized protein n=1 Tax=Penicillium odoratum TaxID=1167516 RepID=UPI002546B67F|nr:uncharacterized protein N7520_004009 [Penicillium odoratum]KAJ5769450.1 hypothetical protein N7520_004009 [Penicillium odoratum]
MGVLEDPEVDLEDPGVDLEDPVVVLEDPGVVLEDPEVASEDLVEVVALEDLGAALVEVVPADAPAPHPGIFHKGNEGTGVDSLPPVEKNLFVNYVSVAPVLLYTSPSTLPT